jgi:starvation-inducible DNA-binding protein
VHLTHHSMPEAIRSQLVVLLNNHLAAAIDLHAQVKQAHWNVRGPGFFLIHDLFAKVSSEVEEFSDQLAGRVGGLGGAALGTVQVAANKSFLAPYSLGIADEHSHVFAISGALAAFGRSVQRASAQATALGDPETADVFRQISRAVDLEMCFVESHIAPVSKTPRVPSEHLKNAVAALK